MQATARVIDRSGLAPALHRAEDRNVTTQPSTFVHLSGTFSYEPPYVPGPEGQVEFQEPAFYIAITLRNDDGTPYYTSEDQLNVVAVVMTSIPQQLYAATGFDGYLLDLTLDFMQASYLGFTATLDPSYGLVAESWVPLSILIFAGPLGAGDPLPAGIITASPYPAPASGIGPTYPLPINR